MFLVWKKNCVTKNMTAVIFIFTFPLMALRNGTSEMLI